MQCLGIIAIARFWAYCARLPCDPARPEFDEQQVLDEMKQYLWAGTETTALTLTWCFYLLNLYPDVVERIRQEGENAYEERAPTWEDITRYRIRALLSKKRCACTLQCGALFASPLRRMRLLATASCQATRSSFAPTSCTVPHSTGKILKEFDPSRFSPEKFGKRDPYSYLPFSAGKRACIGGALSIVENTLALTQLLRRFRLEYMGEVPARVAATVTLAPQGGVLPFRVHAL